MNKQEIYHVREVEEVLALFDSNEHGLSNDEAKHRLKAHGSNDLPEAKRDGIVTIFLHQFRSSLIFILLVAAVILFLIGDAADSSVIFFVLLFNAVIGTLQEGKAQSTFLALKRFIRGEAVVLRDREEIILPDRDIVPGDVIILREGEKVPADARIISANALRVDESALTGESLPKHKNHLPLGEENVPVSARSNMVFKGTVVGYGNGRAVVVATGSDTFLGAIAKKTLDIDADFPLKRDIRRLSRFIIVFASAVSLILLVFGVAHGYAASDILKIIVAVAVSVIPEGLPIVITVILAGGVWRMGKRQVLVKKLQAIEVLGETKILAVDKTGTVTKNELEIERVFIGGDTYVISGKGYTPEGEVSLDGVKIEPLRGENLVLAGRIAALHSSASLIFERQSKTWKIAGDPTEGALLVFAKKIGLEREQLLSEMPKLDEIPFDYERKYHASLHASKNGNLFAVTGSPEAVLALSDQEYQPGSDREFSSERKAELQSAANGFSEEGLRVIGFAYASVRDESIDRQSIPSLTFAGFFGIKDTLREGVSEAVRKVESFGMKVVMITGDHAVTARSVAREAGIYKDGDESLDGEQIGRLDDESLACKVRNVSVFSRVTPEHKLKLIQAYRSNGTVVAMTGDGVNDAPSLSAADIGIGMGKIGTEVAKEASDLVLLDDNFANIVHGVEEGRNIFFTIRKIVLYLFSTSLGEILVLLCALFFGFPLPISAVQILWLNLVTDGFLVMALGMEPNKKRERFKKTALVDKLMMQRMFWMAVPMMIGTLYLFSQYYQADMRKAGTIALTTMAVFQWFNAWNCRSAKDSVFSRRLFSNKYLTGATVLTVLLQILAVYTPLFQGMLKTVPLTGGDWMSIITVAFSIVVVEEIRKEYVRFRHVSEKAEISM